MSDLEKQALLRMTSDITAAYVTNHTVDPREMQGLITRIYTTLGQLATTSGDDLLPKRPEPAVPIDQSVTEDFIYSLEDGEPYKSLKRHLKAKYGMSPEDYREKWGLPADYPMVAPNYARERSRLAKQAGLGRQRP